MKKYILIVIVGISVLLGAILSSNRIIIDNLQAASSGVYSPQCVAVRVRNDALDITWQRHPENPPVDDYKIYCGTVSGWPYTDWLMVDGSYRWAELSVDTLGTPISNGTTYYILVTALLSGAESDTSINYEWSGTPAPADTTVSRNISGGTTASAYTMFSTPVEPQDTRMSAVLGNDLGPYDNTQWRCFHWEADVQAYEEGTSSNDMGPDEGAPIVGHAIWLISRNNVTIHSTGCVYDYNNSRDYEIYLDPGWNQIGCPFNMRVAWQDVKVDDPSNGWCGVTTGSNQYIGPEAWGWYGGAYKSMINLVPTYGVFLYNNYSDDIKIRIPCTEASGPDYSYGPGGYAPAPGEDYDPESSAPAYSGRPGGGPPPPPPGFVSADLSSGGGGGCFIATAAFGTPMAEEVVVLRKFRDDVLLPHPFGRAFVKSYYKTSPSLARFIRNKPVLKAITRIGLKPLIWFSRLVTK